MFSCMHMYIQHYSISVQNLEYVLGSYQQKTPHFVGFFCEKISFYNPAVVTNELSVEVAELFAPSVDTTLK